MGSSHNCKLIQVRGTSVSTVGECDDVKTLKRSVEYMNHHQDFIHYIHYLLLTVNICCHYYITVLMYNIKLRHCEYAINNNNIIIISTLISKKN